MPVIRIECRVAASPEVCFDLARSVDAHVASAVGTGERAVGGVTAGLMELGDEVTWRARHLGFTQELTSRITRFDRPRHFRDEMLRGAFATFVHDHYFEPVEAQTRVIDVVEYAAPLGWLGRLAERLVLQRHLTAFLETRAAALKSLAEGDEWERFVRA